MKLPVSKNRVLLPKSKICIFVIPDHKYRWYYFCYDKMNKAKGPLKLVVPLKGWSSIDREESVLYNPAEDRIFVEELKKNLRADIEIEEVDCNLEDIETAQVLVNSFDKCMKEERG